jgi:hypothetical protein
MFFDDEMQDEHTDAAGSMPADDGAATTEENHGDHDGAAEHTEGAM